MNKQVEVIRQEIEKRRDFLYERYMQKGIGCIEETRYDECVEILSFIDSLPDCTVKINGQGRVKDDVYDSLSEETCKDSLQVHETCKENTDSFTSLKSKVIGYRITPNELGEIESADVIILAANNVIYTDYITLYPVWTIAHKQEEVLKEVEEFKKRKLKK